MAYDTSTKSMVLLGDRLTTVFLDDTWAWNGTSRKEMLKVRRLLTG
jgi:hypothetical protein